MVQVWNCSHDLDGQESCELLLWNSASQNNRNPALPKISHSEDIAAPSEQENNLFWFGILAGVRNMQDTSANPPVI